MSEADQMAGTDSKKAETLQRIDQSWTNLLDAFDSVPVDAVAAPGVCDEWSIKDLAGHIAFWTSRAGPVAIRLSSATPTPAQSSDGGVDFHRINQEIAAKNANRPYDDLMRELHQAHAAMMETLRALPTVDPDWVAGNTFEHYDEHAAEIREWRRKQGASSPPLR